MKILLLLLVATGDVDQADADLRKAAAQLSSDRFAEREAATRTLWEAGRAALELLQATAASDDPEAAARARELLGRIRFGVTPRTSPEVMWQTEQYRRGDAKRRLQILQELHERAQYERLVLLLRATEPPSERDSLLQSIESRLVASVRLLLARREEDRAERLLAMLRSTERGAYHWVAFHRGRGTLDRALDQLDAEAPVPADTARLLCLLHRARGDAPQALRWARLAESPSLLDGLLIEQQQWAAISDAGEISPASNKHVALERLGAMSLIHQWAGRRGRQQAAVEQARQAAQQSAGLEQFAAIEVLLLNGELEEGLELLKENNPFKAVFYLAGQFRHDEALRLAGAEPDRDSCRKRIQQTVDRIRGGGKDRDDLRMALEVAVLADTVGWPEVTDEGLEALAKAATDASRRYLIIGGMVRSGRRELAFKYANSTRFRTTLFRSDASAATAWGVLLKSIEPMLSQEKVWRRIDQLLHGSGEPPPWTRLEQAAEQQSASGRFWLCLAQAAGERGDDQRRERYARRGVAAGYAPARRELGDALRQQQRWRESSEAYLGDASGTAEAVNVYLAGDCLRRAGDAEQGERLCRLGLTLPLGDSRRTLGSELESRGLEQAAREAWGWDLQLLAPRSSDHANAALQIGDMAEQESSEASIRMWRLQLLSITKGTTTFTNTISYARLPCMILQQQARQQIDAGRLPQARATLEECVRWMPMRISVAEELTPRLDELGQAELGQWLYEQYRSQMLAALERFPDSSLLLNNTAWLSATCGRDLPQAQRLSEKSLELEPQTATYLDTLAEIHYRQGRVERALELIRQCLALDPQEPHFRRQLQRFTEGRP